MKDKLQQQQQSKHQLKPSKSIAAPNLKFNKQNLWDKWVNLQLRKKESQMK